MKKRTKTQWRERLAYIRALVREWDPMGVMKLENWPPDEYDCFLVPLRRRLEDGQSEDEVALFLDHETEDHFGLGKLPDTREFAHKFVAFYRRAWLTTRAASDISE